MMCDTRIVARLMVESGVGEAMDWRLIDGNPTRHTELRTDESLVFHQGDPAKEHGASVWVAILGSAVTIIRLPPANRVHVE
jgi:hypothetical protein